MKNNIISRNVRGRSETHWNGEAFSLFLKTMQKGSFYVLQETYSAISDESICLVNVIR